ncbi:MAG: FtsQ-type POTRA domain-containing protein [Betaproteobacteria bacterium]|nr:FtsQ-type POTRA domain-containing protein [Betaproteobacteria bacterium]MDH4323515.1 FtsQ-type POTRA domain-containing protein [Betaproteobacteria bacterium]MDH5210776.1 FtsQ-type POTRA domain-containing protein [Betaproteobacteria bacterium]
MWDNPRLLNAAAGALTALALMVFAVAAMQLLLRSAMFPLREMTVRGALAHTSRAEIEKAAQGRVGGNFFAVDLAQVRAALEGLPWVRRVEVRRVWPDRLEATLEEHVALARWAEGGLVNVQGERFAGTSVAVLPHFAGPAGSEGEVARRYRHFGEILAPLAAAPERLTLSPRYAWRLRLGDGLAIELGRDAPNDPVEARLARLVVAYPHTLARMPRKHEYVDLRYPNGFALRLADAKGG